MKQVTIKSAHEKLMEAFMRCGVDGAMLEREMRIRCSHYAEKFGWSKEYEAFAVRHAVRCAAMRLGAALAHGVLIKHPQSYVTYAALMAFGYNACNRFGIRKTRFSRKEGVTYVRAQ